MLPADEIAAFQPVKKVLCQKSAQPSLRFSDARVRGQIGGDGKQPRMFVSGEAMAACPKTLAVEVKRAPTARGVKAFGRVGARRQMINVAIEKKIWVLQGFERGCQRLFSGAKKLVSGNGKADNRVAPLPDPFLEDIYRTTNLTSIERVADDPAMARGGADPKTAARAANDVAGRERIGNPQFEEDAVVADVAEMIAQNEDVGIGVSAVHPDAGIPNALHLVVGDQDVAGIARADGVAAAMRPSTTPRVGADVRDGVAQYGGPIG